MKEPTIENVEEIALAVRDMSKAAGLFEELLGFRFEDSWERPKEKIKVRSERIDGVQFQLLESTAPDGVISKFLDRHGEGLHHIAFRVTNLTELVVRLKQKEVVFIPEEPVESPSSWYIFIHPKAAHGVLIELIEPKKVDTTT